MNEDPERDLRDMMQEKVSDLPHVSQPTRRLVRRARFRRVRTTLFAAGAVLALAVGGSAATSLVRDEALPPASPRPMETSDPPVLHLNYDPEVVIYADGWVLWEVEDGDPGYLQMRLTPEAAEQLRLRAVSTGLFERDQRLAVDREEGFMEVRLGGRSVIVGWGRHPRHFGPELRSAKTSVATREQAKDISELVEFFADPTAWDLPRDMYVDAEISPFVPSRLWVTWDLSDPDWSALPSPAREIVSSNLDRLLRDGCQVISFEEAREIAQALTQARWKDTDLDVERGMLGFNSGGSFVHSGPSLPHELTCTE